MDELRYLTDEERGPVLEILLTRILLNPKQPQLVGLSAVLGKSEALVQWLRAKMIREDKRPVELRQGVFFDGKFRYREFNSGNESEEEWFPLKSEREAARYIHSLGLEETRGAFEKGLKGPAQVIEFKKAEVQ